MPYFGASAFAIASTVNFVRSSTIFLPSEASGVMGALGGLKALLQSGGPVSDTPPTPARPGTPRSLQSGEPGKSG